MHQLCFESRELRLLRRYLLALACACPDDWLWRFEAALARRGWRILDMQARHEFWLLVDLGWGPLWLNPSALLAADPPTGDQP